jgi:hypothetical protein
MAPSVLGKKNWDEYFERLPGQRWLVSSCFFDQLYSRFIASYGYELKAAIVDRQMARRPGHAAEGVS